MKNKESKLDEIYALIEYSKKTGIALTEEQLSVIAEREEQYIKEEVLPLLRDSIEPVLRKIKRELTLVVNYRPNEPIRLRISRDPNLFDIEGAVDLTPDEIPEYRKRNKQHRTGERRPNRALKVTMDDGTVIFNEGNATKTFCDAIKRLGLFRVRNLGIMASGINIVSTTEDPHGRQTKVDDLFVFTNRSTSDKAKILKEIAKRLNISINIEVTEW